MREMTCPAFISYRRITFSGGVCAVLFSGRFHAVCIYKRPPGRFTPHCAIEGSTLVRDISAPSSMAACSSRVSSKCYAYAFNFANEISSSQAQLIALSLLAPSVGRAGRIGNLLIAAPRADFGGSLMMTESSTLARPAMAICGVSMACR